MNDIVEGIDNGEDENTEDNGDGEGDIEGSINIGTKYCSCWVISVTLLNAGVCIEINDIPIITFKGRAMNSA